MPRPIHCTIHPAALRHNFEQVRRAAQQSRIWAVVKADAYGHGIERVFDAMRAADGFALLDLAEAERIRALGWRGPILLLEGVFEPRDLELCSRLSLWHAVHCDEQIDWLAAHKTQVPQRVFLKMNSGMNRLGFRPERLRSAWARLNALTQVDEVSLMMHFSDADGPKGIDHAMAAFEEATQDLPGERCIANSAALLRHADRTRADWVRPGIVLYGSAPDYPEHDASHWQLLATQTLATRLIGVQVVQPGEAVGYGSRFVAEREMRIGVAAVGYADGYPRVAPTGTPVLVDGMRTGLIGRVSMDMLAVDLSHLPHAGVGSEVTLWGQAGTLNPALAVGARVTLPIDEVAHAAGTLGYELMCAVAPRVPVTVDETRAWGASAP